MEKFILIFTILLFVSNCKNDDSELVNNLPNASQTGENIFACIVGDDIWIADNGGYIPDNMNIVYDETGEYFYGNFSLNIYALKVTKWGFKTERINMLIEPIVVEGGVDFGELESYKIEYTLEDQSPDIERIEKKYYLRKNSIVDVTITNLDTIKNICSGKFNFKLSNLEDSLDVISVSNGRFDGIYRTY